jgi:surfeit locus 1 family protein
MSSRMRKIFVPTVMTAAMLVVLVWLGFWQLERLAWKDKIFANMAAPVLAVDAPVQLNPDMEMRRVSVFCTAGFRQMQLVDRSGFTEQLRNYTKCAGRDGVAFVIDHGVDEDALTADSIPKRQFTGTVRAWQPERWSNKVAGIRTITRGQFGPDAGVSPYFVKEGPPPDVANISNNHFMYALQWFAFAGVLTVVYGVYARRVWRG